MADVLIRLTTPTGSTTAIVPEDTWTITQQIAAEEGGKVYEEEAEAGYYEVAEIPGTGRYTRYIHRDEYEPTREPDEWTARHR